MELLMQAGHFMLNELTVNFKLPKMEIENKL